MALTFLKANQHLRRNFSLVGQYPSLAYISIKGGNLQNSPSDFYVDSPFSQVTLLGGMLFYLWVQSLSPWEKAISHIWVYCQILILQTLLTTAPNEKRLFNDRFDEQWCLPAKNFPLTLEQFFLNWEEWPYLMYKMNNFKKQPTSFPKKITFKFY